MSVPDVVIEPVGDDNFERTVPFLSEWVSDGEPAAREHLAAEELARTEASRRSASPAGYSMSMAPRSGCMPGAFGAP
jgi:hypothetical protein